MKTKKSKGNLFVISGPSGVGKGTLLVELLKKQPTIKLSISATTRKPREGEVNGINYNFTTKENFKNLIQNDKLLEWAQFADNYYGTYTKTVEESMDKGINLALEIDVQGALQIKDKIKNATLIFIHPPSIEELQSRLQKRNTETPEVIQKRLAIVKGEIEKSKYFHHQIVNDDFNTALNQLESIIIHIKEGKITV